MDPLRFKSIQGKPLTFHTLLEEETSNLLSPAEAKRMTEWQEELSNVSERDTYVLQHNMFTDCTITIGEGDKPEEVKCHRVYLAKSSPVFASMLFGELRRQDEVINLPDVSLEAFNAMLNYIYSGKIDLTEYSYKVVCGFLYIAKKYLLPRSLRAHLRAFLWHRIYLHNVWTAILFAKNNDEPELEETAWQVVEQYTHCAVMLDSFVEIPKSTLLALVQREHLSCTELQLFDACMRWAESEAGRQDLAAEPANLRDILAPVIPHIRFLAMDGEEFVTKVLDTQILSTEEMLPITANFITPNANKVVDTVCSSITKRNEPKHESFFVFGYPESDPKLCGFGDDFVLSWVNTTLDEVYNILGIEVPTQIKPILSDATTYDEDITVFVLDYYKHVIETCRFTSQVSYNSMIEIPFKKIISDNEDDSDVMVSIGITVIFHKNGRYPLKRQSSEKEIKMQGSFGCCDCVMKLYQEHFRYIHNVVYK